MANFEAKGLGVALVTPFKKDKNIDYDGLKKITDHVISGGADFLVVLGTTAETPALFPEEKRDILKFVKEYVDYRVPLVLGLGSNCTAALLKELKETDLEGYSAILSVVPFYNKPTQAGIYNHFKELAKVSPLPIILYNVPGRTGVNMEASTTLKLCKEFNNIIAIKEASGKLSQIEEIIRNKPNGFNLLSGDDGITLKLMEMGASGVISVVGNALTDPFNKIVLSCSQGKFDEANGYNNRFAEFYDLMFKDGNPAGIKCALHCLGLIENELRLPLLPVEQDTCSLIKQAINKLVI